MSANNRFVAKNGLDNNGFTITNVAQGTADDDVATRGYSRDASNIDTGTLNANRLALSGVSAGSYGTAQAIPVLTIDNKGRVTSATSVPFTRVTNFTYTPGTTTFTIFTGDGTQFAATIPIAVNDQAEFGSFSFDAASTTFSYVSITTEEIQDVVGGMFTSNSELGLVTTYNDTTGKIDIDVDDFTISLSGDLAGSATITNLANATIVATIQPNSVDLGTDTVGDYIATASVSGVGLSGSATGEGSTFTVTSNATAANTPDTIVSRDVDGSFVAQDITADGNLSVTGTINRNPVITLAGDLSGSVTLTDLQSGTLAATIQPNSVALGTDTTGNYVGSVAAGAGIVVTGADGEGVTKTVAHADTSNQASVDNANGTVIQDITLDGFGHITSIGSVNLDGRYYTEAESDARFFNVAGDTITGTLTVANEGGLVFDQTETGGGGYIPRPGGAYFNTTAETQTGAIQIRFPIGQAPFDMLSFHVDVYDYAGGAEAEAFSAYIYGYNKGTGASWVNTGATIISDRTDRDFTVRFGRDASYTYVWIGETNSSWNYAQIVLRDFQVGFSSDINAFATGWDISFVTAFATVDSTSADNYPVAKQFEIPRNIALSGDVVGNVNFDGSANVTIATTIQPNSVALGTDTTGNYVGSVAAGSGITVAGADGEGVTKTVSHADTSAQASVNNANGTVIQDITLDGFGHLTAIGSVDLDARYLVKNTGYNWTAVGANALTFQSNDTLETSTSYQAALQVYQDTAGADAFMQFHVTDDFAAYFGLKGDINDFAVGGWSMGNNFYRVFHDNYHPNADTWTTARTITLAGDLTGSVSINGSSNVTLSAQVVNDSHTHDGRYYTEAESDARFVNVTGDTMTGVLTLNFNSTLAHINVGSSGAGTNDYNYVLSASNDTGTKAVHFINSSTRAGDGGVNTYTIRNDGGPLRLGRTTQPTIFEGTNISLNSTGTLTVGTDMRAPIYYDSNNTAYYGDFAGTSYLEFLGRRKHETGHLVGSYNNIGGNSAQSNPIYTIGSSYNPAATTLGNMYGIGYSLADAAGYVNLTGANGWGMYVAADGDARIFLDATNGRISSTSEHYVGANRVFHDGYHPNADTWTTARTITLAGDLTGSVSINGSSNVTLSAQVVDDSHEHDGRYYTEAEADSRFINTAGDTMLGTLALEQDLIINQCDSDGITMQGNAPTINFRDNDHRVGYLHCNYNVLYVLTGPVNSGDGGWSQVANGRWPVYFDLTNNNMVAGGDINAISFTQASDERLKENIVPLENALEKVLALEGVRYNKKDNPGKEEIGFIAQKVKEIIPEVVFINDTRNKLEESDEEVGLEDEHSLEYNRLTALLVEAIKEQQEQINKLQEQLNKPSLFTRFINLIKGKK